MEARSAAEAAPTQVAEVATTSTRIAEPEIPEPTARAARRTATTSERRSRPSTVRATARPMVLSREQEYRYIRKDLQRLLVTAGVLLVIMIALLLVLGT